MFLSIEHISCDFKFSLLLTEFIRINFLPIRNTIAMWLAIITLNKEDR